MALYVNSTGTHGAAAIQNVNYVGLSIMPDGDVVMSFDATIPMFGESSVLKLSATLTGAQKIAIWNAIKDTVLGAIDAKFGAA